MNYSNGLRLLTKSLRTTTFNKSIPFKSASSSCSSYSTTSTSSTSSRAYSKLVLTGLTLTIGTTLFLINRKTPLLNEAATISIQLEENNKNNNNNNNNHYDRTDLLSSLAPEILSDAHNHLTKLEVGDLIKQYVVYLISEQSFLVERGPWMLKQLEWTRDNVPFLGSLVWSTFSLGMKGTFYDVFVGGSSVEECGAMVKSLAQSGVGVALSYSAEASVDGSSGESLAGVIIPHVEEACRAFLAASRFQPPSFPGDKFLATYEGLKPTMLAIKLTGLVYEPALLSRASSALNNSSSFARGTTVPDGSLFPKGLDLSDEDHLVLDQLFSGLREICAAGRDGGVRVLVDAEQSWFQPAIDHMVELLAEEFNTVTPENSRYGPAIPIVHNTYQCYRRSAPEAMAHSIALAESKGYSFGAKLVRGAYVESERSKWASAGMHGDCTIWDTKAQTDACFDACAGLLEKRIARELAEGEKGRGKAGTGVFVASHNGTSAKKVLDELRKDGLAKETDKGLVIDDRVRGRISFGQLMGMSDNLTNTLTGVLAPSTKSTDIPYVFKWVPYATIEQALPYLIRRANENQSILKSDPTSGRGGARGERRAVGRELRSRVGLAF